MMETEILQQLQENGIIIQEGIEMIDKHFTNIESGLKIIMTIAVGFFVWQVIKVIYKLFAGVFFGGV